MKKKKNYCHDQFVIKSTGNIIKQFKTNIFKERLSNNH